MGNWARFYIAWEYSEKLRLYMPFSRKIMVLRICTGGLQWLEIVSVCSLIKNKLRWVDKLSIKEERIESQSDRWDGRRSVAHRLLLSRLIKSAMPTTTDLLCFSTWRDLPWNPKYASDGYLLVWHYSDSRFYFLKSWVRQWCMLLQGAEKFLLTCALTEGWGQWLWGWYFMILGQQ